MSEQPHYCPQCHAYGVIARSSVEGYVCRACGTAYSVAPLPPAARGILLALGLFFLVSFVGLGAPPLIRLILLPQSGSWPTTQGVIEATAIEGRTSSRTGAPTFIPVARYSYTVDGASYTSGRIRIHPWGYATRQTAEAEIGAYAVGQTVEVAYLPLFPGYAYLRAGYLEPSIFLEVGVGGLLLTLGLSALGLGLRIGSPRFWQRPRRIASPWP